MAFDQAPSVHIPGITVTDNKLVIPLSSIVDADGAAQLTESEVVDKPGDTPPTLGDIRKVVFALAEMLYGVYANMPIGDRPTQMTLTRSKNSSESTEYRYHNMQFVCAVSSPAVVDVADEPA